MGSGESARECTCRMSGSGGREVDVEFFMLRNGVVLVHGSRDGVLVGMGWEIAGRNRIEWRGFHFIFHDCALE